MNFLAATSFISFAMCVFLTALVLWKCPDRRNGWAIAFFSGSLAYFSLTYAIWQMSQDATTALFRHQLIIAGVIWIQQAFLYQVLTVLHKERKQRWLLWLV